MHDIFDGKVLEAQVSLIPKWSDDNKTCVLNEHGCWLKREPRLNCEFYTYIRLDLTHAISPY